MVPPWPTVAGPVLSMFRAPAAWKLPKLGLDWPAPTTTDLHSVAPAGSVFDHWDWSTSQPDSVPAAREEKTATPEEFVVCDTSSPSSASSASLSMNSVQPDRPTSSSGVPGVASAPSGWREPFSFRSRYFVALMDPVIAVTFVGSLSVLLAAFGSSLIALTETRLQTSTPDCPTVHVPVCTVPLVGAEFETVTVMVNVTVVPAPMPPMVQVTTPELCEQAAPSEEDTNVVFGSRLSVTTTPLA